MTFPKSEESWEYDGVLSYSAEYHMTIIGFSLGILLGGSKKIQKEASKEMPYLIGTFLLGFVIRYEYDQWNG
jgi:hypothetical protein